MPNHHHQQKNLINFHFFPNSGHTRNQFREIHIYENPYTQFDWIHAFQQEPSSHSALFEWVHSQSTVDKNPYSVIVKDIFFDLYLYWKYIYFEYNSHNGRMVLSFLYRSNNNTLSADILNP